MQPVILAFCHIRKLSQLASSSRILKDSFLHETAHIFHNTVFLGVPSSSVILKTKPHHTVHLDEQAIQARGNLCIFNLEVNCPFKII